VIAIDAEWGQGKTWFAQNWKLRLTNSGHSVVYVDAFQSDYVEDPFILLASEINALIKDDSKQRDFIARAKDAAVAIAPSALRLAAQAGGKIFLGASNIGSDLKELAEKASGDFGDSLGKLLESRIKNHKDESKSIEAFRSLLRSFASEAEKPIVIIIDELDRCQPSFAVRMLERIKHLFDVQNVIFVLCMNKAQLCHAIQGVYGQGTDAHTYLEKFLNFTFTLEPPAPSESKGFIASEFAKYEIPLTQEVDSFLNSLAYLSYIFQLTPRQLERCMALLALASPVKRWGMVLAEVVVLKVARPAYLAGMLSGSRDAALGLLNIFLDEEKRSGSNAPHILEMLVALHSAEVHPDDDAVIERIQRMVGIRPGAFMIEFRMAARSVNLPIS